MGSWRADRQEMGGLSAPREEANFRQLQCPLQLELAAKSAKPALQLQPLSAPGVAGQNGAGVPAWREHGPTGRSGHTWFLQPRGHSSVNRVLRRTGVLS